MIDGHPLGNTRLRSRTHRAPTSLLAQIIPNDCHTTWFTTLHLVSQLSCGSLNAHAYIVHTRRTWRPKILMGRPATRSPKFRDPPEMQIKTSQGWRKGLGTLIPCSMGFGLHEEIVILDPLKPSFFAVNGRDLTNTTIVVIIMWKCNTVRSSVNSRMRQKPRRIPGSQYPT